MSKKFVCFSFDPLTTGTQRGPIQYEQSGHRLALVPECRLVSVDVRFPPNADIRKVTPPIAVSATHTTRKRPGGGPGLEGTVDLGRRERPSIQIFIRVELSVNGMCEIGASPAQGMHPGHLSHICARTGPPILVKSINDGRRPCSESDC